MTRIRWEIGDRLSPLHAARCWASGSLGIDPLLAEKISEPLSQLTKRLAADGLDLASFWSRLVVAAASGAGDADACREALSAAGVGELGMDATASAVSTFLAETRLAYQERFPKSVQQLTLRARPLREQWDAYGAGLLRRIATQTHESFIPKNVVCVLLSPYRGGDGDCDTETSTLWIEAVLTNPVARVPEVLRLAWLVSRIGIGNRVLSAPGIDIGHGGSTGDAARSAMVVSLAAVPVVLEAAAFLELGPPMSESPEQIATAVQAWCGQMGPDVVETIGRWWSQSEELKPPFPVSLKALDRMLPGKPSLQWGATP
jgi:hypothetical protein